MKEWRNQLFTPKKIADCEITNRLIVPAMVTNYCTEDGMLTERYMKYIEEKAKGGFGLIITEDYAVCPTGKGYARIPGLYNDEQITDNKKMVENVHSTIMSVGAYLLIDQLIGAFLTDEAAFGYGVSFTRIMLMTSFLYGVFYVLTNVVQGFGEAKASLLINVSRQGIIFIPTLFIMQALIGMNGLVRTQVVSDVISIILIVILFGFSYKKIMATSDIQKTGKNK